MRIFHALARSAVAAMITVAFGACSGNEQPEVLLKMAQASLAADDPAVAEIHLKNLLQQDQNHAEARYLLGGIYRAANDPVSAEKEYRRARDLGFDRNRVMPALLESMHQLGMDRELLSETAGITLGDPKAQAQALTSAGLANARLGQAAEARRSFTAALAAKPDHVPAQVGAARIEAIDDRAGAGAAVDEILRRYPESPEALLLKGDLELADRKLEAARRLYNTVADRSPTDLETRARLVPLALDLGDVAGAKQRHEELSKLAPGAPATNYLLALIEAHDNNPEAARDAVNAALRVSPDYLPAVSLAASLNLSLNALEQAERYARLMTERAPDSAVGYRILGATYLKLKAPDRALEAIRPILARMPADPVLLSIAGEASLKLGEPAEAAGYFERASKIAPQDARSRTGLALSHLAAGERKEGIGLLEQAVEIDSSNLQADIVLVMAHARERQFDKALAAVKRMEEKAPNSAIAAGLRGSVLSAQGEVKGARSAFEKALAIDPAYFPAAANLAALDLRDERPGEARQRYLNVLAKDPRNAQAAVAIATLTARTGGPREQVLNELKKAREDNPDAVLPIVATARYLIDTNAPKDAIPMLQEAANRNPENTHVLDALATAFLRSGQRAQAIGTWERLLRIDPKSVSAQIRIGEAQFAGGERDSALASFRKAAAIAPDAVEPQVGIAMMLHHQGKRVEAMRIATRMRESERNKVAGMMLEGDLLAVDRKWAEAADSYRSAFAKQRSLTIGVKTHRALQAAKHDDEADRFLRDWIRADPANVALRMFVGDAESTRQRWKQAFEHYAVVLAKQPDNALALNNAAWALHELKDTRALHHARRAYEIAPKSPSVLDTYGVILAGVADRKALEMLRQAIELAPDNARIRLHLAEALASTGDKGGARAQVDELLKATPEGDVANAARELRGRL